MSEMTRQELITTIRELQNELQSRFPVERVLGTPICKECGWSPNNPINHVPNRPWRCRKCLAARNAARNPENKT